MDIYVALKLIWAGLLCVLLIGLGLMVGMDMGVGTLLRFVGRTDVERRTGMVIRSGSFWVVVPFLRRSPRCMPRLFRCFMWL